MFGQQGRKVTILSQVKQILFMKCVNFIVRVFSDDCRMNEVWFSFILGLIKGLDAVKRETTRKTSDGTE